MFGKIEQGMVYLFLGKMGAGKTTNAAKEIERFHKNGDTIWLYNMEVMDYPKIKKGMEHAPILKLEKFADLWGTGEGLLVADEILSSELNSREWKDLGREVGQAFTHMRKLHMTGILLAQSWQMVEVNARRISSYARKFEGSRFFGRYYGFTEYEIDDAGEIVKMPEVEYSAAVRGFRFIQRKIYDLFDTDRLVEGMRQKITFKSAVVSDPDRTWTTPDEWLAPRM